MKLHCYLYLINWFSIVLSKASFTKIKWIYLNHYLQTDLVFNNNFEITYNYLGHTYLNYPFLKKGVFGEIINFIVFLKILFFKEG